MFEWVETRLGLLFELVVVQLVALIEGGLDSLTRSVDGFSMGDHASDIHPFEADILSPVGSHPRRENVSNSERNGVLYIENEFGRAGMTDPGQRLAIRLRR